MKETVSVRDLKATIIAQTEIIKVLREAIQSLNTVISNMRPVVLPSAGNGTMTFPPINPLPYQPFPYQPTSSPFPPGPNIGPIVTCNAGGDAQSGSNR